MLTMSSPGIFRFCQQLSLGFSKYHPEVEIDFLQMDRPTSLHQTELLEARPSNRLKLVPASLVTHGLFFLKQILGRNSYDVVHLNYALSSYLSLLTRNNDSSFLYTVHGFPRPWLEQGSLEQMLYRMEDLMLRHKPSRVGCVSISDYVARVLREFYGLRTTVIYHGLDGSKFTPVDESKRREMKKVLSIDNDSIVISWVGRLVPMKDPITFVKSLAYMRRVSPEIERRLYPLIVGDGPLSSAIRHLSESEKLPLRIIPKLTFNDLISLYQVSDLYVSSSVGEPFGLSLLEAIACGCCPIVTNAGAHLEIVPEDYNALFEVGDYIGLASQLGALTLNASSRKSYATRARKKFLSSFTLKNMTENYLSVYNSLA